MSRVLFLILYLCVVSFPIIGQDNVEVPSLSLLEVSGEVGISPPDIVNVDVSAVIQYMNWLGDLLQYQSELLSEQNELLREVSQSLREQGLLMQYIVGLLSNEAGQGAERKQVTSSVMDTGGVSPPPTRPRVVDGGVPSGPVSSGGEGASGVIRGVETKRTVKVVMLHQKGLVLDDGRKISIGETFEVEGNTETLSVACPVCGVIVFESGKRLRF